MRSGPAVGPATGDSVLEVRGLSKTYATRVVRDVDLVVRPGRVRALLGGNGSGKSTLLKMLAGVVPADPGGRIVLSGEERDAQDYGPAAAFAAGLRFVHQDLGLVDQFTIAENFGLVSGFPRRGWIDDRALVARTRLDLRRAGLDLDPRRPAGTLRPGDRARVAIARALRDCDEGDTRTLVLDEPTASLPIAEVEHLLSALRDLRAAGHAVVLVTHRLGEVLDVADDITVLRDGAVVGDGPIERFDEAGILELIAGHASERLVRRDASAAETPVLLRVDGLTAGPLRGIDLEVKATEIVGVAGLVGSGRTSLLRALFGDLPAEGAIEIADAPVRLRSTRDAVRHRIAMVPEDRVREAVFPDDPIWENLSAAALPRYRTALGLSAPAQRRAAPGLMARFAVRAPSPLSPLSALSGGNQQKVVLGRWLQTDPLVLLLDEPTQGVDAVARDEIHRQIRTATDAGACALVVSSDVEELEQLCDRVIVLSGGRVTAELRGERVRRESITAAIHEADRVLS